MDYHRSSCSYDCSFPNERWGCYSYCPPKQLPCQLQQRQPCHTRQLVPPAHIHHRIHQHPNRSHTQPVRRWDAQDRTLEARRCTRRRRTSDQGTHSAVHILPLQPRLLQLEHRQEQKTGPERQVSPPLLHPPHQNAQSCARSRHFVACGRGSSRFHR